MRSSCLVGRYSIIYLLHLLQIKYLRLRCREASDKGWPEAKRNADVHHVRGEGRSWVVGPIGRGGEGHVGGKKKKIWCELEQTTKTSGGDKSLAHNAPHPCIPFSICICASNSNQHHVTTVWSRPFKDRFSKSKNTAGVFYTLMSQHFLKLLTQFRVI